MENGNLYHNTNIGHLHLSGNLFLAPVAGWSDRAFRSICTECGADFATTEMVSSEAVVRENKKTLFLTRRAPNEKALAVQLFGSDPDVMGRATEIVLSGEGMKECHADCIDINCGCPVPKITKCGAGSALMKDSKRLFAIIQAVASVAQDVPVTVKIRKGWGDEDTESVWEKAVRAAVDAGAMAITMHPRLRSQGYEGRADWSTLSSLVHFVCGKVRVFGSGDLFTAEDAEVMIKTTGVDGVMFARGAMGNPFIFSEARALLTGREVKLPTDEERINMAFREAALMVEDYGEETACKIMRKRFVAYTKKLHIEGGCKGKLRQALVKCSTMEEYRKVMRENSSVRLM